MGSHHVLTLLPSRRNLRVKIQHGIPMRTRRRIPNLTIAKQAFLQEVAMIFLVSALSDVCMYRGITCFSKHFDVSYRSLNKFNFKQINCENEGKLKLWATEGKKGKDSHGRRIGYWVCICKFKIKREYNLVAFMHWIYSYSYFEIYSSKLRIFLKLRQGNLSCLTFFYFHFWDDNDIRIMFLERVFRFGENY